MGSVKAAVLLQKDTAQPERVNKLSENEEETDKQDLDVKDLEEDVASQLLRCLETFGCLVPRGAKSQSPGQARFSR